ncbi:MAG TPA: PadR family transcriptional regulator [Streptosporangiaceae bacterium]|nr:PadR family transcriptional regulator [Streptosporangiaceae bacterium]
MHDESWGDPREHRGGHRMRMRMRGGPGPGPGPWGGPFEFGPRGGPFGPKQFRVRGPRVRRGDVRAAILDLLGEGQPWNGYQIIQEIGARTQGVWRPSAGSVYPALQQLEDEALIRDQGSEATGEDRRRMYTLTEEGRAYVEEHADELKASWDAVTGSIDDAEVQLHHTMRQVFVAVSQVAQAGSAAQVQQAGKILADTRRALYRILASDGEEAEEDSQG